MVPLFGTKLAEGHKLKEKTGGIAMINKKAIDKLLEMPDDRFLAMLKILLGSTGMDMSGKQFDEKTVRKIRAVLREVTDEDLKRVDALMQRYKEGG